jgi:L-ascorbate metabolism protein UlaG (beta-lactamase superfamily)
MILRRYTMKLTITKYIHACLLVETPQVTGLFDPGSFSGDALDLSQLVKLDHLIITHEHPDHFDFELVKSVIDKFPQAKITTTENVARQLASTGIKATTGPGDNIELFAANHEDMSPIGSPPPNIGVHYADVISHPGDSHHFSEIRPILALPVTAPWGSMIAAVRLALKLKPRFVVPIHDWHWSDNARAWSYDRLEKALAKENITFLKVKDGQPQTLEV